MDIVLCTDNNYIMPTGVLMCSVCENNKDVNFHVVLGGEVSKDHIEILENICLKYNAGFSVYHLDYSCLDFVPYGRSNQPDHVSLVTYFRLFLAEILPKSLDRVLYLDGDIICLKSLEPLWSLDLEDCPLAASVDMDANEPTRYERLDYPSSFGYFNAGVLLVNLKYWRSQNVLTKFKEFVKSYPEKVVFYDQDVLNFTFVGRVKWLDIRYNLQSGFLQIAPSYVPEELTFNEYIKDPYLVHFTTKIKPWVKGCPHPYTQQFLSYYHMSPWRTTRLALRPVDTLRGRLVNVLVRLGLHTYHGDFIKL